MRRNLLVTSLCLLTSLLFLFHPSLEDSQTLFNNDGPLGIQQSAWGSMPAGFQGRWLDIMWLGYPGGTAPVNLTSLVQSVLTPLQISKYLAPLSLFILGLAAWLFCWRSSFPPIVCTVVSLATALNMNVVSHVGWGLSSRALCMAAVFLALAAVAKGFGWRRLILAGVAVGLSIMEGQDNGAIFSLYVAAYVLYMTFQRTNIQAICMSVLKVAVVAVFAGLMAWQVLNFLGSSVPGPAVEQKAEERWNFATQWSLPKMEALRLLVPGLYGIGSHTPGDAQYWGAVGQQPGWEQHHQGFPRYSGTGEYAGLLVLLIAGWALMCSFSKDTDERDKCQIWFWSGAALVSLLMAFGRHAPFYQLVYHLPYFSNIRNPIKFMHPFHLSLLIVFAYGLRALVVRKHRLAGLDLKWSLQLGFFTVACLMTSMIYLSAKGDLLNHLQALGFQDAASMAAFSYRQVGVAVILLLASVGAFVYTVRANKIRGLVIIGILLVADLSLADRHWIIYYNHQEKYASNQVIDQLRLHSAEGRVTELGQLRKLNNPAVVKLYSRLQQEYGANQAWMQQFNLLNNYYDGVWLQALFPYYNIPALDMAQEPRVPAEKTLFNGLVGVGKLWTLTSTRYVVGMRDPKFQQVLNEELDPEQKRFQLAMPFELYQDKAEIKSRVNPQGPYAIWEFTGALPKAKIYSSWFNVPSQWVASAAIQTMNPQETVAVEYGPQPVKGIVSSGEVDLTSYRPTKAVYRAKVIGEAPVVMMVNDRYDPDWQVTVDGKRVDLLRCNYLMKGVALSKGEHVVEFAYKPNATPFYVSLITLLCVLGLCLTIRNERC